MPIRCDPAAATPPPPLGPAGRQEVGHWDQQKSAETDWSLGSSRQAGGGGGGAGRVEGRKAQNSTAGKNSRLSLEGGVQGAERPDQLKRLEIPQSFENGKGRGLGGVGAGQWAGLRCGHFEKRILATCLDNRVSSQLC